MRSRLDFHMNRRGLVRDWSLKGGKPMNSQKDSRGVKNEFCCLSVFCYFLMTVVFVSFCYTQAFAGSTGKIAGRVFDAKTHEPLVGVTVLLTGTTIGASTDLNGNYFIANIPIGTYSVRASMVGYMSELVKDARVLPDLTTTVNFDLQVSEVNTNEVVVEATRPPVQKDITATQLSVRAQDIQARPVATFSQVLASLPSIDVSNGVMTMRGRPISEVAFMVDGARLRNPLDQNPFTDINLSAIQEVQVITGPFNAEYGEAQSGVVNIITKEGGDKYTFYLEGRLPPPHNPNWGPSLYDLNTPLYWDNTHARHLQWWIQYPDQWVDPNGNPGSSPLCIWTPEQAYKNYLQTHQPLTDYTSTPTYQIESSFGGPVPDIKGMHFFLTGKYLSEAPTYGNTFRKVGIVTNFTGNVSYEFGHNMKLLFSSMYANDLTGWGFGGTTDNFYALNYGVNSRYAYYDFPGLPKNQDDYEELKFSQVVSSSTMYEIQLSKVHAIREVGTFPNDTLGFAASGPTTDNLRAVGSLGNPIIGAYQDNIGYHTTGYYYRYNDSNTDWTLNAYLSSQINPKWDFKTGIHFDYYNLNHDDVSKLPDRTDHNIYNPFQGAAYLETKLELGGMIMNAGLRWDFYDPNSVAYDSLFDPLVGPVSKAPLFSQLSPRLGISHPIDEWTVLHFSYGWFFERGPFGDYGEGSSPDQQQGSLTTFIINGTNYPWVLGNRDLKPSKTVAYEIGIERNFANLFDLDVTGYYKDISNTIRIVTIATPLGVYATNGNGDYADVRGIEISLNKLYATEPWGTTWGYANYTTELGIDGRSGAPTVISPSGVKYSPSGDFIQYNDPILKFGLYYQTPDDLGFLNGVFSGLRLSFEYQAIFPNPELIQDYFVYNGTKYVRPAYKNGDMRLEKDFTLFNGGSKLGLYVEVDNVFNDKWLNLSTFQSASLADQQKFATSGFKYIPTMNANGSPISPLAMYENLPRSLVLGASIQLQ